MLETIWTFVGYLLFKKLPASFDFCFQKQAEGAGIEPATAGVIRLLLVLKTNRNTSSNPSVNSETFY
jgi:hypothetical protein